MPTYKDAGVDVKAGYEAVRLMKKHVNKTFTSGVLTDIGGFGGLFALDSNKYKEPVLVSGTDGVGTKLKIAFMLNKHDTIGIDCVAMCVNDIVCCGAKPLFFLDYLAVGKNIPHKVEKIVKGVADGCIMAGCSLVGGETAEMPGFYPEDEYDMAGFAVGIIDKDRIIDKSHVKKGDKLVGIASSGIHSNGYSLVRKLLNPDKQLLDNYCESLGRTWGEELLEPTKIYVKSILELISEFCVNGIGHITGGGFIENIPRMLPDGLMAKIYQGSWPILSVFKVLQDMGSINEKEMYNTFNMGIGMVLIVEEKDVKASLSCLESSGEKAYLIGEVIKGQGVKLC